MGRGINWTEEEASDLARAWVNTLEDPIVGIDQTSTIFFNTMFDRFSSFATDDANRKQYRGRGIRATRAKWDAVSADYQKFRTALRHIKACQPTGVTDAELLSMAIAKHLGKRQTMSYDAKNYPRSQWLHNKAYKVLRQIPKFREDEDSGNMPDVLAPILDPEPFEEQDESPGETPGETLGASATATPERRSNSGNLEEEEELCDGNIFGDNPSGSDQSAAGNGRQSRGSHVGRKREKENQRNEKLNELALKNAKDIAEAMKRRIELIEEKNAMKAFTIQDCVTEQDKKDREEFFRLTRSSYLQRMRARLGHTSPTDSATYTQQFVNEYDVASTPPQRNVITPNASSSRFSPPPPAGLSHTTPVPQIPPPPLPPALPRAPQFPPLPSYGEHSDRGGYNNTHTGSTAGCLGSNSQHGGRGGYNNAGSTPRYGSPASQLRDSGGNNNGQGGSAAVYHGSSSQEVEHGRYNSSHAGSTPGYPGSSNQSVDCGGYNTNHAGSTPGYPGS